MYEREKKKFARLYACVMLLLSAMLLLVSSIPVVRMELGGERSEWFRNGSYTGSMEDMPGELRPDINTMVRAWRYMGKLRQIVRLQTIEAEIRQTEIRIEETMDETVRTGLEASLTKLRGERESAASPEQEEALHRLTAGGKLDDLLCAWDAYVLPSDFGANDYTGQLSARLTAIRAVALLAYLTFAACFPVFATVWLIAKAIDLLLHYRKLGKPELQRLSALHGCFAYALANLVFLLVFTLTGLRPGYRPESIVWLVALTALACVLNAVCRSVFAEEPKQGFWLRQSLRALSLAAAAAAACAFISLGLPALFLEHANDFGAGYAQSIAEQADSTGAFGEAGPAAQAADAVGRAAAIVFVISGAAVLAMAYLLARGTRRFAFWKPVRARCALGITASGVLVLLLIAIPVYLGAGSAEEQSRAGREGEFRVLLDAYRVEGSEENLLYRSRIEERQELEASIAQMEEALRSSTGEDTLRIIAEKESLQTRLAETEAALDDLQTHQVRDLSIGIAGAAAALIAEIVSWRITKRTQRTATP